MPRQATNRQERKPRENPRTRNTRKRDAQDAGAANTFGDTMNTPAGAQPSSDPAPYDQARPGMPADRIIHKGERERPGPTHDELVGAEELIETDEAVRAPTPPDADESARYGDSTQNDSDREDANDEDLDEEDGA
jgi:hypothetical protein